MPTFRYTAMTAAGAVISGEMESPSPKAVIEQLQNLGHFPIATMPTQASGWRKWLSRQLELRKRASPRELAHVSHELATLLHAGLPLERALEILGGLENLRRLQFALASVLARVRDGSTLADALSASPHTFPPLYVGLVRAGEAGGNIEVTLFRLADYFTRTHAFRESLKSAMIYPTLLVIVALLALGVILVFVLPEFEPMFQTAGVKLPTSTRFIIGAGHFVGTYWWLLLGALVAAIAVGKSALDQPATRLRFDSFKLRLPILGLILRKIETERFSRALGTLLSDGVPLPTALALTKDTLANAVAAKMIAQSATIIREGESLADLLSRGNLLPAMALDLIRVGEETGKLEDMLLRQADIYDREVRHAIERLFALLVPGITVTLGFIVAGLIASLLTAILSINNLALR